eukprot:1413711-Amphidinium_carterae.2
MRVGLCPFKDDGPLADPPSERVSAVRTRMKALQSRAAPRVPCSVASAWCVSWIVALVQMVSLRWSRALRLAWLTRMMQMLSFTLVLVCHSSSQLCRARPCAYTSSSDILYSSSHTCPPEFACHWGSRAQRSIADMPYYRGHGLWSNSRESTDSSARESTTALQSRVALLEAEAFFSRHVHAGIKQRQGEALQADAGIEDKSVKREGSFAPQCWQGGRGSSERLRYSSAAAEGALRIESGAAVEACGPKQAGNSCCSCICERARVSEHDLLTSLRPDVAFKDRLLNDKSELTKRCELFTEELKTVERSGCLR